MKSTTLVTILNGKESFFIFFVTLTIGLSAAVFLYISDNYSLLYYGDSVSHLVNARQIVDWMEPGLIQLGTVWLPLPHLMLLPFSLIDPLFVSGFAGLIVSLPFHALTSVLLYKLIRNHVGYSFIGIIGALLYASNPNLIYLGITAMTEAPFMLFFVASVYYFDRWNKIHSNSDSINDDKKPFLKRESLIYLALSSVFISLATLCRYEAWILPVFIVPFIFLTVILKQNSKKFKISAKLISLIAFSGIVFWVGWNQYLYENPFEFVDAEFYSASSQALDRTYRDFLYLQPINVATIYGSTVLMIYGPVLVGLAAIGFAFLLKDRDKKNRTKLFTFLSLPPIFTIVTLLIGIGEMSQWWFNARFAVFLAPLIIILVSFFIANYYSKIKQKRLLLTPIIVALFIFQILTPIIGVVTFLDAESGFVYKQAPFAIETGEFLESHYDDGTIMIMTGSSQAHRIMVSSGIHLIQFDDIIESHISKKSFQEPWIYDKWIIIGKEPDSDSIVPVKYWEGKMDKLKTYYNVEFENQYYKILLRK